MKKIIILLILMFVGVSLFAQTNTNYTLDNAQSNDDHQIRKVADNQKIGNSKNAKNIVKLGIGGLAYERAIKEDYSIMLALNGAYYGYSNTVTIGSTTINASNNPVATIFLTATPRWYPSKTKNNLSGWNIGLPITGVYNVEGYYPWGVGANIGGGYQWIMPAGLAVDLFLAPIGGLALLGGSPALSGTYNVIGYATVGYAF